VANGIARLRIDLSFTLLRNSSSLSVWPYQASKMSKFTATTPLTMWAPIIGLFFTHFQVKFLRNLASEIINFFPKYVVQLLSKVPVLFRASDTSTLRKWFLVGVPKSPKKPTPHSFLITFSCYLRFNFQIKMRISERRAFSKNLPLVVKTAYLGASRKSLLFLENI
jgi:hypothetical protein